MRLFFKSIHARLDKQIRCTFQLWLIREHNGPNTQNYKEQNPDKYTESLGCFCSLAGGEPDQLSLHGGPYRETSHVIYTHQTSIHPEGLSSMRFLQRSLRQTACLMTSQQRSETDKCTFSQKFPLTISETALHRGESVSV